MSEEPCLHCEIMRLLIEQQEKHTRSDVVAALLECVADLCNTAPKGERKQALLFAFEVFAKHSHEVRTNTYKPDARMINGDSGNEGAYN